ncbi:hypothetical protein SALBM135S_02727 [Streptomyces alboniger]
MPSGTIGFAPTRGTRLLVVTTDATTITATIGRKASPVLTGVY